jgi:hypothetical protein
VKSGKNMTREKNRYHQHNWREGKEYTYRLLACADNSFMVGRLAILT